ncbi:Bug family tripartite tricarboxylate transporter substrate binding protein [Ottowia thiooxydans]|uniref:Bug family tripartite tricarboxylate transporter substrate binding protein n=1 Tax=Ottowia thiooxydans TaxID=219182 RepID=UPI000410CEEB|nr:tripartite tricarboxylate transporter substrate binding protein [Ottowia thiooxydans]
MIDRRQLLAAAACSALSLSARAAQGGTEWPQRAVKIILGFPAGQGSDVLARLYAAELNKALGQPFVVDNRPGAGATLAARDVARSAPDGYNLLLTSSGPLTVAPHLYSNLGFDPMKDLDTMALIGRSPLILLVRPDSPIKTLPELVAAATRQEMTCGSGGNGVTNHLALEMFKVASGARLMHVPYKGAAPALTDLMGGQIQTLFEATSAALAHVRSGRLRALAVSSPTRYSQLPDVPSVAEFYPGFDATAWAAFAVPHGTPQGIVDKLASELNKCQLQPAMREKLIQSGVEPTPDSTPATARAYAQAEFEKWRGIIRHAGVKLT